MQTGGLIAVCAVLPIILIASGILVCSICYRRRSKEPDDIETPSKSRTKIGSKDGPRRLSTLSFESKPDVSTAPDSKSLENLPPPSLWNVSKEKSLPERPDAVKETDITDMRQMIAQGQIGAPKGRELRKAPAAPVADWHDLANWQQLPAPRMLVPDDVRLSHYAM